MPIRLNLLAEDQAAEDARRRDPFKRSIWVAGFVVCLVLLWGLSLFLKIAWAKAEVAGSTTKWETIAKSVKQVETNQRMVSEIDGKLTALTQFTTNRFLWANCLEALQQTWVEDIQLLQLKSEQTFTQNEPPKLPANASPAVLAITKTGGSATERITISLSGRDFSPRVGVQVPRYIQGLSGAPFFQQQLQKTNSVQLTSLSAPQVEPQRKTAYVVFGLKLNFQEKERPAL